MIEKLKRYIREEDGIKISCPPDNVHIISKINEIIDWINDVSALRVTDKQVTANMPNIDAGELAFLSKENSELKDEVELLQKKLKNLKRLQMKIRDVLGELPEHASIAEDACWDIMLEMEQELDNE